MPITVAASIDLIAIHNRSISSGHPLRERARIFGGQAQWVGSAAGGGLDEDSVKVHRRLVMLLKLDRTDVAVPRRRHRSGQAALVVEN
jgi:hypothetical protein